MALERFRPLYEQSGGAYGYVTMQGDPRLDEEVREGDYVIVHAGFAISKLDAAEARETLRLMRGAIEAEDLQ